MRPFLLVNTNVVRPPVSPVGLEYVGESLVETAILVGIVDLAFEEDWQAALRRGLANAEPLAVGLSVRNTDDCCYLTGRSFLPWIREVVGETKKLTSAPVVLGGVGFSVMPEAVLEFTGADIGIAGDGEEAAIALARALDRGDSLSRLSGIVYREQGRLVRRPRQNADLLRFPPPRRGLFDNRTYQDLGAMVGIETKRGCPGRCVYCADPVAKGKTSRLRPPAVVVEEFRDLVRQGISWFHLSDSEFNLPPGHAREVCRALIDAGLGDRLRWYCYCSPVPFDAELAGLMKMAGCAGINFGVDSLCDAQLSRLGRRHTAADVTSLVKVLYSAGLKFMFDLLVGGPGETAQTLRETIERALKLDVPQVGTSVAVRLYPGTALAKAEKLSPLPAPAFYLSPALEGDVWQMIVELTGGDPRFVTLAEPAGAGSYNYAGDNRLSELIKQGARGAYWDILRQFR